FFFLFSSSSFPSISHHHFLQAHTETRASFLCSHGTPSSPLQHAFFYLIFFTLIFQCQLSTQQGDDKQLSLSICDSSFLIRLHFSPYYALLLRACALHSTQ